MNSSENNDLYSKLNEVLQEISPELDCHFLLKDSDYFLHEAKNALIPREQSDSSDIGTFNATVIGQTGVGKSQLINYLFGSDVVESGVGKPVTQKKDGFEETRLQIQGIPVKLFDSWGLEVGKEDEWLQYLDNELSKRSVDKPPQDWFHAIFYCIDATGARVQDCDINIMKRIIESNYKVKVIFTKCDLVSEEDSKLLQNTLRESLGDNNIDIVEVCAVKKVTRAGTSNPFGKQDIETLILKGHIHSLVTRLPKRCEVLMKKRIEEWYSKSVGYVSSKLGPRANNLNHIQKTLSGFSEIFQLTISDIPRKECQSAIRMYSNFFNIYSNTMHSSDYTIKHKSLSERFVDLLTGSILSPLSNPIPLLLIVLFNINRFFSIRDDAEKELVSKLNEYEQNFIDQTDKIIDDITRKLKETGDALGRQLFIENK